MNLHGVDIDSLSAPPPLAEIPAPVLHLPNLPGPERGLPQAPGDRLYCSQITREAAIEIMTLCGGFRAEVIREKLESGRKAGGPERADVIAWLCREGYAWRPRPDIINAKLTEKGRTKAKSVLIHVSAGNY